MTRRLLACGLVAGPLFVLANLIEGAVRSGGYDALRHPVSSLALGDQGWTQTANFLVSGLLTIPFAVGLWHTASKAGAVLIGIWGIGLVGAGLFVTDPVSGYPVGTPDALDYTTIGALHDGFSLPGFAGLALGMFVVARWYAGRRRPALAAYSVISGSPSSCSCSLPAPPSSRTRHWSTWAGCSSGSA
jgi:hypothetical protein